jgi:hypothetical protein
LQARCCVARGHELCSEEGTVNSLTKFKMMQAVEANYTSSKKSDSEFAAALSEDLGEKISYAMIRQARFVLCIKNNAAPALSQEMLELLDHLRAYFVVIKKPNLIEKDLLARVQEARK